MPAAYSQKSAATRADRQARAGYTHVGTQAELYETSQGFIQRKEPVGLDLPPYAPGGAEWNSDARLWYMSFRLSPQAELLNTRIDWMNIILAVAHLSSYCDTGNYTAYRAFERMIGKYGTTPADRKKIRVDVGGSSEHPEVSEESVIEDMASFDEEMAELEEMIS